MSTVNIWRKDVEIALRSLKFHAHTIDLTIRKHHDEGLPVPPSYPVMLKETRDAIANLTARLARPAEERVSA